MKSESQIQDEIRIKAAQYGCILFRNNSGVLRDETGRPVRYGLANESKKQNDEFKSSDLIGIKHIVITPDMVGKTVAVFTAIEVKKEDWKPSFKDKRENAQRNFLDWVQHRGGFALMTNSIDEVVKLLKR